MRLFFYYFFLLPSLAFCAEAHLSEAEAERIGTELYLYGYPLITMDLTRKVMTNTVRAEGNKAPMGQFSNMRNYPDASMHTVTSPNADTLYSSAWLDLSQEPYILHVPDENGRYYLMPMLSAWTEVFADPGTRTTGTKARDVAILGPGWQGKLPKGVKACKSPTNLVWIIGRTYCTGTTEDYAAVHRIQDQYSLVPLSAYKKNYTPPPGSVDPSIDMTTPVRDQVERMDAAAFFGALALLMQDNPAALKDEPWIETVKKIGFIPGEPFDMSKLDASIAGALQQAPRLGLEKIRQFEENRSQLTNGWLISFQTGEYGTDYLLRASVAAMGLGANLPKDAVYPVAKVDRDGIPLNGKNQYILHFPKGQTPPVKGFWSLTLYNERYFFSPNSLNRYSLSPRNFFKYNQDGSLDLYIQSSSPGKEKEANWLPAPEKPFILMLRLYWPEESFLKGIWKPPGIQKNL